MQKTCTKCRQVLPVSEFSKKKSNPDGLQKHCKDCCRQYARGWRASNAQKKKEKDREYAKTHAEKARLRAAKWRVDNPERAKQAQKAYVLKNAEAIKQKQKAYRERNAESIKISKRAYREQNKERLKQARKERYHEDAKRWSEQAQQWAKSNPDKRKRQHATRKARALKAVPKWADFQAMDLIYADAKAKTVATREVHHVDHVVPLVSKIVCGLHWEGNLQVITATENITKSNKYWPNMPED